MAYFDDNISSAYEQGFWIGVMFREDSPQMAEIQQAKERMIARGKARGNGRAFSLGVARGIRSDVSRPCEYCGR